VQRFAQQHQWRRHRRFSFGAIGTWCVVSVVALVGCRDPGAKQGSEGKPTSANTPPRKLRPLPDVDALAREFDLPVSNVRAAFETARRMTPIRQAFSRSLGRDSDDQAQLGRLLFFDRRLSSSGGVSCQTCHVLSNYGVDSLPKAVGHEGREGRRNTPSVFNVGGLALFFWDGRATTLEAQAKSPLLHPDEMALSNEAEAISIVKSISGYAESFRRAFPDQTDPISFDNIVGAIAAYERRLITPAPWDRFLAGDDDAISMDAKRGFSLIYHHGCGACHTGVTFGGHQRERFDLTKIRPDVEQRDQGFFELSGRETDRLRFRVPSLRNVEKTAPYFHDGSVDSLDEAVRTMARVQLSKELDDRDVGSFVSFLKTLTGEPPAKWITPPELPK
jgi:cytochrome c peroxidase